MYQKKTKEYWRIIKIAYYQFQVLLKPTDASAYYHLGKIFAYHQELSQAVEYYDRAIEYNHAKAAHIYCQLGGILVKLDRYKKAAEVCRKSVEIDSSFFKSHFYLGEALVEQNQYSEAIPSLEKAISLNPQFYWSYYHLIRALTALKKHSAALQICDRAARKNSTLALAYYDLGLLLKQQDRWQQAEIAFERHIELNPRHHRSYDLLAQAIGNSNFVSEPNNEIVIDKYKKISQSLIAATHPDFLKYTAISGNSSSKFKTPDFLIIGQPKCGTSSLYSSLIQHPQILPAIKKEIFFWNRDRDRGLKWYEAHFPEIPLSAKYITGEATTTYLSSPKIAADIFSHSPKVKLIVLLRNPVARTISEYYMACRSFGEQRTLEEAILGRLNSTESDFDVEYLRNSRYIELVEQWMAVFPREQFLILQSEKLFNFPQAVCDRLFEFLNVAPYQLDEYSHLNNASYANISEAETKALQDYFRPYNQQLEKFLDRKFDWYN